MSGRRSGALLWAVAAGVPLGRAAAAPTYFVGAESRLGLDRWRGATPDAVQRADVRQRLALGVFGLEGDDADRDVRVDFDADLEIGADLGPSPETQAALPVDRRARFDLHRAAFDLAVGPFSAVVGRHVLVDEVGYDALDGVTARLAVGPSLGLEASGGLAVRRPWSGFGPDVYTPDGGDLPDRRGHVLGAAVFSRGFAPLQARASWRRLFDDAVQREEAGLAAESRPADWLRLDAGLRYDTVWRRMSGLRADATVRASEAVSVAGGWQRDVPTFSADSIWNAFGAEPWDDVHASTWWADGPWRVLADGSVRFFDAGEDGGGRRAWEAGVRFERAFDAGPGTGTAGAEARLGTGYGGERHYGDVFAEVPVTPEPGAEPLRLRVRAGAVHLDDPSAAFDRDGVSGWLLVGARWPVTDTIALEAVAEEHASRVTPSRLRVMGRLVVEDWL